MNTLPYRQDISDETVGNAVKQTHRQLSQLLEYESAPLSKIKRYSGIHPSKPLFSALLNYRHNKEVEPQDLKHHWLNNVEVIKSEERTNYPIDLAVEDFGHEIGLTSTCIDPACPQKVCEMMSDTLNHLVVLLTTAANTPVNQINPKLLSKDMADHY